MNAGDKEGGTALMEAAANGRREVVKALIAAGADVNARDHEGNTALSEAVKERHFAVAEALRAAGATRCKYSSGVLPCNFAECVWGGEEEVIRLSSS